MAFKEDGRVEVTAAKDSLAAISSFIIEGV
jgi:hypothetical protein